MSTRVQKRYHSAESAESQTPHCPQSHRLHTDSTGVHTDSTGVSTDSTLTPHWQAQALRMPQFCSVASQFRYSRIVTPRAEKTQKSWTQCRCVSDVLQNWNCFSALNFKTPVLLGSIRQQAGRRAKGQPTAASCAAAAAADHARSPRSQDSGDSRILFLPPPLFCNRQ